MKILGIDTSGYANAVGIVDGGEIRADFNYPAKTDSLEKIVLHLDAVLKEAELNLGDIDGIGVGVGPGSWTGIRVGVTVGKMLAYSTGKPIAGIPSLEVLAYAAKESAPPVCAIINAGAKNTVYAGFYRAGNRTGDYYVGDVPGLVALIQETVMIVSAEVQYYCDAIKQALADDHVQIEASEAAPSGVAVARLAEQRLLRGEKDDVLALAPLYLKESTARAFIGRYMRTEEKG
ncbi:MAG: tRNA (adenosine(37)-N6)-threonylcarbamoyltransferase complex dimerization subunit type 1 TsaB [Dehalococcoidales bacterium]|nr:tRNA (adenosine(37)-N6)-threonylcarbamoyltransferase complex dimerization subunit type 1 TsaB [Dehalococcoidales bacterium]